MQLNQPYVKEDCWTKYQS